jgi:hypothetical protein
MPQRRKRYTAAGKPAICTIEFPGDIAKYIYREARARGYSSETELMKELLRDWIAELDPMSERQWKRLCEEFKAEDEEADRQKKENAG